MTVRTGRNMDEPHENFDKPCALALEPDHRSRRMNPGWLRFIRAFADQLDGDQVNPFGSEPDDTTYHRKLLILESDGHPTSDGRLTFCESYFTRGEGHKGVYGWEPALRVFLANDDQWARIECYQDEYVQACEMAMTAVTQSYIDEEENA